MRDRFFSFLLLVYGAAIATLVATVVLIPLGVWDRGYYFIHGVAHSERQIADAVIAISRQAFPHFYGIHIVAIGGFLVYGIYRFGQQWIAPYVPYSIVTAPYALLVADRRRRLFVFITLTVVFIICLVVEEAGLRIAGMGSPYLSPYEVHETGWLHTFLPGFDFQYTNQDFTQKVRANSLGFADREWPVRSDGQVRIACFGDSFTEGVGAAQDSSYPRLLGAMVPGADILNFGVSASDPVFSYMVLKKVGIRYAPDIATFTINISDIEDILVRGGLERFRQDGTTAYRRGPWWQPLYDRFAIARLVADHSGRYDPGSHIPLSQLAGERAAAFGIMDDAIDSIHALCALHHIRCVFLFHPVRAELLQGKMECSTVRDHAIAKGYEVIDLLAEFHAQGMDSTTVKRYYWAHDSHHTAAGYHLFATILQQKLFTSPPQK